MDIKLILYNYNLDDLMRKFILLLTLSAALSSYGQSVVRRDSSKDDASSNKNFVVKAKKARVKSSKIDKNKNVNTSQSNYYSYTTDEGIKVEGVWDNDVMTGSVTYPDGVRFEGKHVNGLLQGQGKVYEDNKLTYEGNFKDGNPSGGGTYYLGSYKIYSSSWNANLDADNVRFNLNSEEYFTGDIKSGNIYKGQIHSKNGITHIYLDDNGEIQEGCRPELRISVPSGVEIPLSLIDDVRINKSSDKGNVLAFRIDKNVYVSNTLLFAKGQIIPGIIKKAKGAGAFGVPGNATIEFPVELIGENGQHVNVNIPDLTVKGTNRYWAFPLWITGYGMFISGTDARMSKGTQIIGYTK